VSHCRQQVFINAPPEAVFALLGDVNRHAEWWPRISDIHCEGMEQGCSYRQVVRGPMGQGEMNMHIDDMKEPEEFRIHCVDTGAFVRFALTGAQGGTFVEGEMGMDPQSVGKRVFDAIAGRRFFRRWLQESLEAMGETAESGSRAAA
jgi:carbon monoxide dehydrogenase subunit G